MDLAKINEHCLVESCLKVFLRERERGIAIEQYQKAPETKAQRKKMEPSAVGGGGEQSRGLARFRSAPATWLEALLESEEEDDPLKPTQLLTQLPPTSSAASTNRNSAASGYADPGLFEGGRGAASGLGFLRHNSSPADFLAQISSSSDGYFSNFGIPSNYDYLSSSMDVSLSSKRPKELDSESPKFSSQSVSKHLRFVYPYVFIRDKCLFCGRSFAYCSVVLDIVDSNGLDSMIFHGVETWKWQCIE